MKAVSYFAVGFLLVGRTLAMMLMPSTADTEFERLALQYVDEFPALSPVSATSLGSPPVRFTRALLLDLPIPN